MSVKELRLKKLTLLEEQVNKLGIDVKYVCLSISCSYHRALHGKLFDAEQIKEIYSLENIQDDCNCSFTQVLVDHLGNPNNPKTIEKIRSQSID